MLIYKVLKKCFFLKILVLILCPQMSIAQLCVVYDADGFTNLREKPSIKATVLGTIIEGYAFAIASYYQDENRSKEWVAINYILKKNAKETSFLKFDGEEGLAYIHKSRLVLLESLPVFDKTIISDNKVVHAHDGVQITIETQIFKQSSHKGITKKEGLYFLDGQRLYPYYGGDGVEIKSIAVKFNDKTYHFPKTAIKNLLMVNASYTDVYIGKKGEYYLVFDAGDGADGYNIIYCLKNNKLFLMTITSTLP